MNIHRNFTYVHLLLAFYHICLMIHSLSLAPSFPASLFFFLPPSPVYLLLIRDFIFLLRLTVFIIVEVIKRGGRIFF